VAQGKTRASSPSRSRAEQHGGDEGNEAAAQRGPSVGSTHIDSMPANCDGSFPAGNCGWLTGGSGSRTASPNWSLEHSIMAR
jgi:hypothetical protein